MKKTLTIAAILVIGLINIEAHATEENEQIRQECEMQVRSYELTDAEEYQTALNDCIESMSTANPMEQYEGDEPPADQT